MPAVPPGRKAVAISCAEFLLAVQMEDKSLLLWNAGGPVALYRGVHDPEVDRRPPQLRVAQYVFLGVAVFARDEPDAPGQERQLLLARRIEPDRS